MQVNHVEDHATHAVITSHVAREVTMSTDAALMHMLSSLIYKNPRLAMVREVMCNAWDAHIDANVKDVPILVTLAEGKLTIRDYGKGIHDDKIASIYGVYGKSTKRNDSSSTGGFGIGSKSPWSYVDHFQVASYHQGKKTFYTMSKASPETDGKPNITPIVTVPTTETGLEVSIDIKPTDIELIKGYVESVSKNSGHPTLFKYATHQVILLNTYPYDKAKDPFLIVMDENPFSSQKIMVKYGAVLYPVTHDHEYYKEFHDANELINTIRSSHRATSYLMPVSQKEPRLILLAPPDSLSLTPSREELSMQGKTVPTIKKLLEGFVAKYKKINFVQRRDEVINRIHESLPYEGFLFKKHVEVETNTKNWPVFEDDILSRKDYIERMVYLKSRLDGDERYKVLFDYIKKHKGRNDLANSYVKAVSRKTKLDKWYYKEVYYPVKKAFEKEGMGTDSLYLCMSDHHLRGRTTTNSYGLVSIKKGVPIDWEQAAILTKNVVIITHRQKGLDMDTILEMHDNKGAIVCVVPRQPDVIQKVIEIFQKLNKHIIDVTPEQGIAPRKPRKKAENSEAFPEGVKVVKAPKPSGYASILEIYKDWENSPNRLDKPKCIMVVPKRKEVNETLRNNFQLGGALMPSLLSFIGGKVGLVPTDHQYKRAEKALGTLINPRRFLLEEVINRYPGKKRMEEIEFYMDDIHRYRMLAFSKGIRQDMDLPKPPTKEEKAYYEILHGVINSFYPVDHVEKTLHSYIHKLVVKSIDAENLDEEFEKCPLIPLVLDSVMSTHSKLTASQDAALLKIFHLVYKEFKSE